MGKAAVVRIIVHHEYMTSLLCQHGLNTFRDEPACVVVDYDDINTHLIALRALQYEFKTRTRSHR